MTEAAVRRNKRHWCPGVIHGMLCNGNCIDRETVFVGLSEPDAGPAPAHYSYYDAPPAKALVAIRYANASRPSTVARKLEAQWPVLAENGAVGAKVFRSSDTRATTHPTNVDIDALAPAGAFNNASTNLLVAVFHVLGAGEYLSLVDGSYQKLRDHADAKYWPVAMPP